MSHGVLQRQLEHVYIVNCINLNVVKILHNLDKVYEQSTQISIPNVDSCYFKCIDIYPYKFFVLSVAL